MKPYNAFDAAGIPRDTILDNNLILATTDDLVFFTRADLIVYPGLKLDEWMEGEL